MSIQTIDPLATELNLYYHALGDEEVLTVARGLRSNTTLRSLDLTFNDFSETPGIAIAGALSTNTTLTALTLSHNPLSACTCKALAVALRINTTLSQLLLYGCEIDDEGGVAIAQALEHNAALNELDLGGNRLTDTTLVAIGQALRINKTLKVLTLHFNAFTDFVAITNGLANNDSLQELNFGPINDAAGVMFVRALQMNNSLTALTDPSSTKYEQFIQAMLNYNRTTTGYERNLAKFRLEFDTYVPSRIKLLEEAQSSDPSQAKSLESFRLVQRYLTDDDPTLVRTRNALAYFAYALWEYMQPK